MCIDLFNSIIIYCIFERCHTMIRMVFKKAIESNRKNIRLQFNEITMMVLCENLLLTDPILHSLRGKQLNYLKRCIDLESIKMWHLH